MMKVMENSVEVVAVPSAAELEAGLQCEFTRAQDMASAAFHVQGSEGNALCGTSSIFPSSKTLTVEGVMLSVKHQNGAWWWCATCAAAFTGQPEQLFNDTRYRRYAK